MESEAILKISTALSGDRIHVTSLLDQNELAMGSFLRQICTSVCFLWTWKVNMIHSPLIGHSNQTDVIDIQDEVPCLKPTWNANSKSFYHQSEQ